MVCKASDFIYTTTRVVKIPNKCLALTNQVISIFVIVYIGGYGLWYCKGYQGTSRIESVTVTKVKGIVHTKFTNAELGVLNPEFYRRVWDSSDVVINSHGDETGGFIILTNIVITPNQTRETCPESLDTENSKCKTDKDCPVDKVLPLGNGPLTGKCVPFDPAIPSVKTCQVAAWCPVENSKKPLLGTRALLVGTKDFTVLVKNSIEFPSFGEYYKRRNIMDSATPEYLKGCVYNLKSDPYCPTFKIGDIVTGAGERYEDVALTGGVFALRIRWFCSFDFGADIRGCRPKYSFARLDNPKAYVSPGFNFRSAVFHEEDRRTLTRNYGLKIVIDVEGEGRKFDSVRLILAIGAGMGLFAVGSSVCDFLLGLFCSLKDKFKWKWLQFYHEEMKYDLTHVKSLLRDSKSSSASSTPRTSSRKKDKSSHELDEIKTLQ